MGNKKINRRDFIKITGLGTGGLMLTTPVFNSLKGDIQVEELKPKGTDTVKQNMRLYTLPMRN